MINIRTASNLSAYTLDVLIRRGYTFRHMARLPVERADEFCGLVAQFIRKSRDHDETVSTTLDKISVLLQSFPKSSCFWVIEKQDKLIGYFFAEAMLDDKGKMTCIVHQTFVSSRARHGNLMVEIEDILASWCRSIGVLTMRFLTSRRAWPFIKKLRGDWEIESVVVTRCV